MTTPLDATTDADRLETARKPRAIAAQERPSVHLRSRPPEGLGVAFWPALAIVPASLGAAVGIMVGGRRQRGAAMLAGIGAAAGLALFRWQMARLFVEEPRYEIERRTEGLEVRRYPRMVRAETTVSGRVFRKALDDGFRRLAGYVFGDNEGHERIDMTSPVTTFRDDHAPMTAVHQGDELAVSFGMPEGRALDSFPVPRDGRVHLVSVPERHVAVLRYSGSLDAELMRTKQRELFRRIRRADLTPVGDPGFAGYDPPSTLPFLRRNEVWIEVEAP